MRLPSSYLPKYIRSAFRFFVLGTTGTFVQTWFFLLAMLCVGEPEKGTKLYYIAFGIGFVCEMIPNYFLSNWYTFGTRPDIKNAGGFLLARAINLVIQFVLLPVFIRLLPMWEDGTTSFMVIFLAGCINYLIMLFFFKKKKENPKNTTIQS